MKAVIQRVNKAKVSVAADVVAEIGQGLVILLGVKEGDSSEDVNYLADKIINLRIFDDENAKMNLSALDTAAEILIVSQFTLYGDCGKGRRPSFDKAAPPILAEKLYRGFIEECRKRCLVVKEGKFGGKMMVEIHNDGPVTLIIESRE